MMIEVRCNVLLAIPAFFLALGPTRAQDRSASEAESVELAAGTVMTDPLLSLIHI